MRFIWPESGAEDMRLVALDDEFYLRIWHLARQTDNPDHAMEIARVAILAERDNQKREQKPCPPDSRRTTTRPNS